MVSQWVQMSSPLSRYGPSLPASQTYYSRLTLTNVRDKGAFWLALGITLTPFYNAQAFYSTGSGGSAEFAASFGKSCNHSVTFHWELSAASAFDSAGFRSKT